jgi:hypothetical protein
MPQLAQCVHDRRCASVAGRSRPAYSQALSSMSAEVDENAIDVALKVARAFSAVGAE